jgi:hypothetical protein
VDEPRTTRGWLSLYVAAFVLMLTAGVVLTVATLGGRLESLRLLRVSAGLSVVAMVAAVLSVVLPRRR